MTTYSVVKQEYEVPCDHPMCPVLHKHLAQYRYDTPQWETYYDSHGIERLVHSTRYHMKTNREWVIIDDATGERANDPLSDAFNTKREALHAIATFARRSSNHTSWKEFK